MPRFCSYPRPVQLSVYNATQEAKARRAGCRFMPGSVYSKGGCCPPGTNLLFTRPTSQYGRRRRAAPKVRRRRTYGLFGPPADVPSCGIGTLCGAPEAQEDPNLTADEGVTQAGMGLPAPGGWLWAGLGIVGGYVLHDMLMKKGKK